MDTKQKILARSTNNQVRPVCEYDVDINPLITKEVELLFNAGVQCILAMEDAVKHAVKPQMVIATAHRYLQDCISFVENEKQHRANKELKRRQGY